MNKTEKALKMLEEFNYQATIVDDKLYITAWDAEHGDSADFRVSDEDIDKWAADYDLNRRTELLQEIRCDLNMIYDTIKATGNEEFYELEYHESFPLKTLLSNIDCELDELQKLESSND